MEPDDEVKLEGLTLENAHLRATLAEDGTLLSLVDKATGREALAEPGNRLELYDDDPVEFDAWDIDPYTLGTGRAAPGATSQSVTASPLRVEITFGRPSVTQVVRLDAGSRLLEFHTTVDWDQSHVLLKVAFPARRARQERDVRDAVRLCRAADALLDERRRARGTRFRPTAGRTCPSTASAWRS